jgi:hypothetical protein
LDRVAPPSTISPPISTITTPQGFIFAAPFHHAEPTRRLGMPLPTDFCTEHCSTSGSFQIPAGAIAHTPAAREETHRPRAS